jgi:hypothetical protein
LCGAAIKVNFRLGSVDTEEKILRVKMGRGSSIMMHPGVNPLKLKFDAYF